MYKGGIIMNCWFCGTKTVWQSDFDFEDYGYEGSGIVAVLNCPNCKAHIECMLSCDTED